MRSLSADPVELSAGPLTMRFEPANAMLRYVRLGDTEILRGVFAAVRDQDWNTVPITVHDFELQQSPGEFALRFLVQCAQDDVRFDWEGKVSGSLLGNLMFEMRGQAKSTFLRNRIGLCVLHPIGSCAGARCTIAHPDGSQSHGKFPTWISPYQPFKNIRSISHEVEAGLQAELTLTGEVFEMEDQRNWTDASFKTYGTPLELPFPVEIAAGTQVEQAVTLELLGEYSSPVRSAGAGKLAQAAIEVKIDWAAPRPRPQVGLGMATCPDSCNPAVVDGLRVVQPDHLRVDLHLDREAWLDDLRAARNLAVELDAKLELATFSTEADSSAWERCLLELEPMRERLARCCVFHATEKVTPDVLLAVVSASLRNFAAELTVVGGTNAYFAELNRNRPTLPDGCQVCYSINPQVHAFDNCSLCETLEALPWTVESAWKLFARPVVISPVTLRPRFNPNATSSLQSPQPESDFRQATGFAAAWTVGVLAQLCVQPDVASITFYETYGPRGILSVSGEAYPLAAVFASVARASRVFPTSTSSLLDVGALALQQADGRRELLLANMSDVVRAVSFLDRHGRSCSRELAAESVELVDLGQQI